MTDVPNGCGVISVGDFDAVVSGGKIEDVSTGEVEADSLAGGWKGLGSSDGEDLDQGSRNPGGSGRIGDFEEAHIEASGTSGEGDRKLNRINIQSGSDDEGLTEMAIYGDSALSG